MDSKKKVFAEEDADQLMKMFESKEEEEEPKKCACTDYDANEIFATANARKQLLEKCGITRECCVRTTLYTVSHVPFHFQCQCWINQGQAMKQMLPKCDNRVIDTQDVLRLFFEFSEEADATKRVVSSSSANLSSGHIIHPSPSPTTPLIVNPATQTPSLFSPSSNTSTPGFSFSSSGSTFPL